MEWQLTVVNLLGSVPLGCLAQAMGATSVAEYICCCSSSPTRSNSAATIAARPHAQDLTCVTSYTCCSNCSASARAVRPGRCPPHVGEAAVEEQRESASATTCRGESRYHPRPHHGNPCAHAGQAPRDEQLMSGYATNLPAPTLRYLLHRWARPIHPPSCPCHPCLPPA